MQNLWHKTVHNQGIQPEGKLYHRVCNRDNHTATIASDPLLADNSALGLFYVCPGVGKRLATNDPEDYRRSVIDMTFADEIPE
ncbi:hypothetical protein Aduo_018917 [Ancylostoma duodenale]